ncbi:hypothetical protein E2562_018048 [Oryza meyeriana var. granulata]|uniref:SKP1 component dimerisation domain-containing protein n=1 Tax=Oryza meyeriana var. granulata TaxID=110450 RepID=A0A6G1CQY8_9ORYZ|nr:hypothetical protein E2562_018048 [Oryza meyeriana var. granulata]
MARTAAATAASAHPAAAAVAASAKPAIKIKVYSQKELKAFDTQFIKDNETSLVYLIEAAKFLGIKRLQELTLDAAANMTKGKTPEQIRKIFNIKSDFTPDE